MIELANPCPLCGDSRVRPAVKSRDFLHGTPGEFEMFACLSCGLWRQGNGTGRENLDERYPAEYAPYRDDRAVRTVSRPSITHRLRKQYVRWISEDRPGLLRMPIRRSLQVILARGMSLTGYYRFNPFSYPVQDEKVLDIGCADGHFLAEMAALGWKPFGVEQNKEAAARASVRGVHVFHGGFDRVAGDCGREGPYDLITLRQVLEHFENPFEVMKEAYNLLVPGGFLAIWTPVRDAVAFGLFGSHWYNLDLPRHRVIFSRKTLRSMVRQAGFQLAGVYGYSSTRSITGSMANRKRARAGASRRVWVENSRIVSFLAKVAIKIFDLFRMGDNVLLVAKKEKSGSGVNHE